MADTYTTNLNLTKPEVGASTDTWGTKLNADLDTLDAIFSSSGTAINLGNVTVASLTTTGDINFGDNDKAVFGAGSDLQIYHDGSNSRIQEAGTGSLLVRGTNLQLQDSDGYDYLTCTDGGNGGTVALKHLGTTVLNTTTNGITVTSAINDMTVAASGLTGPASQNFAINTPNSLRINIDSNNSGTAENFIVGHNQTGVDASNNVLFMVAESGKAGFGTTNANANVHIGSANATGDATNPALQIGGSSSYRMGLYTSAEGAVIENKNGDDGIQFRVKTAGEAMRIDSSGKVGIGKTPQNTASLDVNGSIIATGQNIGTFTFDQVGFDYNTTSKEGRLFATASGGSGGFLSITTGNNTVGRAERMRIDSSGLVGIGTTSPSAKLEIDSNVNAALPINTEMKNSGLTGSGNLQICFPASSNNFATGAKKGDCVLRNTTSGGDIFFGANNAIRFGVAGTDSDERMRITSAGDVGIGMTPAVFGSDTVLSIYDAGTPRIKLHNSASGTAKTDGAEILLYSDGTHNDLIIENRENGHQRFYTNGGERIRITTDGNLLVGTTSAGAKFHVNGTGGSNSQCFLFDGFGYGVAAAGTFNHTASLPNGTTTGDICYFAYQGTNVGEIDITTTSTNYRTSSDYRLKENVNYEFNALSRVVKLKPARFNFIADADTTVDGFLAHEVEDIVPNAVAGEKDGEKMQSIDHSKLVPLLTKAIQEQQAIIDDLKSRIETLEG